MDLDSVPPFETEPAGTTATRWDRWVKRFENYLVAKDIVDDVRKRAMLLHLAGGGFDFKTKFHKNPQLATTYGQKAPIAQYVRRIYSQIAVRFCAICSIYIMPKALGDISTVSILI